ncbi:hypothetical protein [Hydrogenophaga sp. RWCD_12]|uniref:hypothetical protein n=1 Tax=Hydrogenophaga sp. RWCD_12 TaxID=3391190 RepID=UPI0039849BD7
MARPLKPILARLGSVLAVAGLAFVGVRLVDYWPQLKAAPLSGTLVFLLVLLAVGYGLANVLLALAWRDILRELGAPLSVVRSVAVYGRSQIAKYAPGNVFHLAGRQVLGMAEGVPAQPLAKSIGLELGLLVVCAIGLIGLLLQRWLASQVGALAWVVPAALAVVVVGAVWHWRWFRAGRALVAQSLFLLFSAGVYWAVLASLAPEAVSRVPAGVVPGAAIAAWLIGLVTPGAPAGLGVREAVMLLILGVWVPQADLVLAVLLARLVNIAGDVGFFLVALWLARRSVGQVTAMRTPERPHG